MRKKRSFKDIGQMTKRADIQAQTNTFVEGGRRDITWNVFRENWPCEVKTTSGNVFAQIFGHEQSEIYKEFTGRFIAEMFDQEGIYRIVYNENNQRRAYKIERLINVEDGNRYMKAVCKGTKWEAA